MEYLQYYEDDELKIAEKARFRRFSLFQSSILLFTNIFHILIHLRKKVLTNQIFSLII